MLWELRGFGLDNLALVKARRAENELAMLDLLRVQDSVAAEVVQAHAQVQSAASRLLDAESGLKEAAESARKNLEGFGRTVPAGGANILVIRPQEVVAAVQALGQAYSNYFAAVSDYDRAQFRLYHALGRPAQEVTDQGTGDGLQPMLRPAPGGAHLGAPLAEPPAPGR